MNYAKTGVVLARLQTSDLHRGHKYIFDWVDANHRDMCVVLVSKDAAPTDECPLSFQDRKEMVHEIYSDAKIAEVFDCPDNTTFSKRIDDAISKICGNEAIIYGSCNSLIPRYCGEYSTEELAPVESPTEKEMRVNCERYSSSAYRAGVINSINNRFPNIYPTVDCAPYKKENGTYYILLGHKKIDGDKYRFVGGFTDKKDISYEAATNRELHEETGGGIRHKEPEYIGSHQVKDYRYENSKDGVMTIFFGAEYLRGEAIAKDDIDNVKWFPLHEVFDIVIESHKPLAEKLVTFIKTKQQNKFKKIINLIKQIFQTIFS